MGTRSRIAVMHGNVCKSVYCHYDGYLEHNGEILQKHYDSSKANQLVALGDLSSLHPEIGEAHPFSPFDLPPELEGMTLNEYHDRYSNMCTFYGRDRGETDTGWRVAHTFEEFLEQCDASGAEYYYVMKNDVWYVGTTYDNYHSLSKRLVPLAEALNSTKETA